MSSNQKPFMNKNEASTPIVSSALLGGEVHGILKKAGGYAFALTGLGMVLCLITKLTGDAGLNIIASIITTFGFGALNALLLVCWRLQAKGILPPNDESSATAEVKP